MTKYELYVLNKKNVTSRDFKALSRLATNYYEKQDRIQASKTLAKYYEYGHKGNVGDLHRAWGCNRHAEERRAHKEFISAWEKVGVRTE